MEGESIPQPPKPLASAASSDSQNPVSTSQHNSTDSKLPQAGLRIGPVLGLMAAFCAGLVGWGLVESIQPVFTIGVGYEIPNLGAPPELFERARLAHAAVDQKNAALNLAILGGLLALGLATSEAAVRHHWRRVAVAPVVGLLLGGLAGYLGGYLHEILARDGSMSELVDVIKVHASMLLPIGLGVGLGLGAVTGSPKVLALGAAVGAVAGGVAAITYTLIVSLAIPTVSTDVLLPVTPFGRFLWMAIAAGLFGLIIPGGLREKEH